MTIRFPRPEHPAPHEAAIELEHVSHQLLQLAEGEYPDPKSSMAIMKPRSFSRNTCAQTIWGLRMIAVSVISSSKSAWGTLWRSAIARDKFGKFRAVEMQA